MDFLTTIKLGSRESSRGEIDMRVNNKGFIQTLVFLLFIGLSFGANAANQKVVQVIAIDTNGNTGAYLENVKKLLAYQKELAPEAETRVYLAGLSGTTTGTIYVIVKYPDIVYMANTFKSFKADEKWKKMRADLAQKTGRKIISNSILYDVTP
jgi:hypothetical protein